MRRSRSPSLSISSTKKSTSKKSRSSRSKKKSTRQKKGRSWIKFFVIGGVWGTVAVGLGLLWFSYDLPDINELKLMPRRPSVTLLDQRGNVLATYGDLYGKPVLAKELPPHVTQAFLAIEDRRFYHHIGVDVLGLIRALWMNYQAGATVQGGSTITQQLAKNFLFSKKRYQPQDRSLRRKIQEAILALWLEHRFTKHQILTMYLNRVYFGSGTYGIDGASRRYFLRSAKKLSLYEAAVLAGLLKAPSRYSPTSNAEKAEGRATQVLQSMVEAGFISKSAMEAALVLASSPPENHGGRCVRYFTDWILDQLPQTTTIEDRDVVVTTTLDVNLQRLAEQKAVTVMETVGTKWKAEQMALVSMTQDGAVKAMLGGMSYQQTKYNRATQALRQTGSTFKFFVFLEALKKGWTPQTLVDDRPLRVGKWAPSNYLYRAQGEIPLEDAFAKSVNAVAVRLGLTLGVEAIQETALQLGITSKLPDDLTLSLGSGEASLLEMTGAFATVARQGIRVVPYGIIKVKDAQTGEVLYRRHEKPIRLYAPHIAQQMATMMQGVMERGTGRLFALKRPSAAKSGTSQAYKDLWFIGFTPELITGVWSGIDAAKPMTRQRGGGPPGHLWKAFMEEALQSFPIRSLDSLWQEYLPVLRETLPNLTDLIEDTPPPDVSAQEVQSGALDQLFKGIKQDP